MKNVIGIFQKKLEQLKKQTLKKDLKGLKVKRPNFKKEWLLVRGLTGVKVNAITGEIKNPLGNVIAAYTVSQKAKYQRISVVINDARYQPYLHQIIFCAHTGLNFKTLQKSGLHVDHIDGDPINNHIYNLRLTTSAENQEYKNKRIKGVKQSLAA